MSIYKKIITEKDKDVPHYRLYINEIPRAYEYKELEECLMSSPHGNFFITIFQEQITENLVSEIFIRFYETETDPFVCESYHVQSYDTEEGKKEDVLTKVVIRFIWKEGEFSDRILTESEMFDKKGKSQGKFETTFEELLENPEIYEDARSKQSFFINIFCHFITKITEKEVYTAKEKTTFKEIGTKKKYITSEVTYISDKKYLKDSTHIPKRIKELNWEYSWLRRGHWRELSKGRIGKDRNGERNQIGRTWIKEARINPELELKNKPRLFQKT